MSIVAFAVTAEKKNPTTRLARGAMVGTQGPQSTLYTGTTKAAVDDVGVKTVALKVIIDSYNGARATFTKARTSLATGIVAWDGSFDVLVTMAEKVCTTADEGAGLGLPVVGAKTKYAFAMPISVDVKQDLKKNVVRIHVHRAPGMKASCVEVSTDPSNPALWKELEGLGAIHLIPSPTPGLLAVRAATRGASAKSAFTTPVSIMVK